MSGITDGITAGIKDFQAWKQQDPCVVFPIITDLHSNLTESDPRNCQKRIAVKHLELLFQAADAARADFAADLGDEGFEVPLKTEEEGSRLLDYMNSVCSRKPVPFIHCIGNHDLFSGRLVNSARWRNYPVQDSLFRFPELNGLLTEFVRSGGKLAGVFSGDSHFDYFDSLDGVNYFVSQGCGGIGPSELPPQARVYHQYSEQMGRCDTFDSTEHCLIDLAAVKTEKREVRIFRLGAGGFYFHRGAKF